MILENNIFNNEFKSTTNDQVEGRYILSTSLMERLLEYKNSIPNQEIRIAFKENKMLVLVHTSTNYLELKLKGDLTLFENVEPFYNQIESIIGIVDTLNLNTQIWHKD